MAGGRGTGSGTGNVRHIRRPGCTGAAVSVVVMERILVSACLLGRPVRYDGTGRRSDDALFALWRDQGRLVSVCPEVDGGLPVPRPPAEISGGLGADVLDGRARVLTRDGADVTAHFVAGAWQA